MALDYCKCTRHDIEFPAVAGPAHGQPSAPGPASLQKWAEEGYAVAQVTTSVGDSTLLDTVKEAIVQLLALDSCCFSGAAEELHRIVVIVHDWEIVQGTALSFLELDRMVAGVVSYGFPRPLPKAQLIHLRVDDPEYPSKPGDMTTIYRYPEAKSPHFVIPYHQDYVHNAASLAHTRTLTFVKKLSAGPHFDLEAIWDEHTHFEFEDRSVSKTLGTMVQEPYVNDMTGGIGRDRLTNFYRHHFIWNNPDDTKLELVSRTVGIDRVIDEFICVFTHNKQIDWLLPGVPPTNQSVRLPVVSVVNVRGDRLYHEHIWWDQANMLKQLGLLPDYLPFPYPLADGQTPRPGKQFEYRLPVSGAEAADKLTDENSHESNKMFEFKVREVDRVSKD
ncbi:hypothetical protein AJ80_08571 [Polytolypa hystricis UAMH7299]|uniref:SnoaL-like domain-containing protein n=1 Tax=Polytolypa hystricis (strain UAMH7299) TaxID=1447883 RepID=A0A2B7X5E0_POLH7|nr:hypothetical protein AJ80_08571 [Polytolypa hystricis UAMH7299]